MPQASLRADITTRGHISTVGNAQKLFGPRLIRPRSLNALTLSNRPHRGSSSCSFVSPLRLSRTFFNPMLRDTIRKMITNSVLDDRSSILLWNRRGPQLGASITSLKHCYGTVHGIQKPVTYHVAGQKLKLQLTYFVTRKTRSWE